MLLLRPKTRVLAQTMVSRIHVAMWSFGPLFMHARRLRRLQVPFVDPSSPETRFSGIWRYLMHLRYLILGLCLRLRDHRCMSAAGLADRQEQRTVDVGDPRSDAGHPKGNESMWFGRY